MAGSKKRSPSSPKKKAVEPKKAKKKALEPKKAKALKVDTMKSTTGCRGVSKSKARRKGAVPPLQAEEETRVPEPKECIICFESLPAAGAPYRLECGHCEFHEKCIKEWLQRSGRCPLCDTVFPEYCKKPPQQKPTLNLLHTLPLSHIFALPGLAQSYDIPIVYY
jgi:hypothetical protein|uniref:RING-type domain-containing protein n=1 Tax=Eutreptiella gymnastica TaxID=73025 RepID=A0A7S4G7Q0_9EUGL